ncbi:MAG: hypothetical protein WC734_02620 [Patescibacteria group bacterium]|jgi:hypothetical protein
MPRAAKKLVAKRSRRVPIRVLESAPEPARPALDETFLEHRPLTSAAVKPKPDTVAKRTPPVFQLPDRPARRGALVWGVGISFMLVLTIWLGVMRFRPQRSGPNSADETIANIGRVLSDFSDQFDQQVNDVKQQLDDAGDPTTPEVKELQKQVFPEFIK